MQKITGISETFSIKRKVTENGEVKYVEEIQTRIKEVPVVDGLPRLAHYLVDRLFIYVFEVAIFFILEHVLNFTGRDAQVFDDGSGIYNSLWAWLLLEPLFYFIFEVSIQSSPAKALFGRVVVNEYGNKPTVKQIFIRSVSRPVPFEILSCLAPRGWHDKWSKTFVIRKKDLKELKLLQKINTIQNTPQAPNE